MIITCECGCNYNNETSPVCPLCNFNKINRAIRGRIKDRRKRRKEQFKDIRGFIEEDLRDKKRTASGYSHRTKTGQHQL
jgi:hypothetical protein